MSFSSCCTRLKLLLATSLLLCAWSVQAGDWHEELPQARPTGQGEMRWFGLSIYSATLWSEHRPFDPRAPFALQLVYHRHINHDRIVHTSIEEIERLYEGRFTAEKLKQWEALMSRAFPDVSDGDQLVGIFIPGHGCRFYDGHGLITDIADVEFAQAFFAIWLDPRTKDRHLRDSLLGTAP